MLFHPISNSRPSTDAHTVSLHGLNVSRWSDELFRAPSVRLPPPWFQYGRARSSVGLTLYLVSFNRPFCSTRSHSLARLPQTSSHCTVYRDNDDTTPINSRAARITLYLDCIGLNSNVLSSLSRRIVCRRARRRDEPRHAMTLLYHVTK